MVKKASSKTAPVKDTDNKTAAQEGAHKESSGFSHEKVETSNFLLIVLTLAVISIGGLVEIVPLFFQKSTTEPIAGLKPYTALQLAGRDIYQREGCYNCHSQMIRPFRAETMRYGHYSVAGLKPYSPLRLAGRDIYIREGCYNCHSQMIRPFRAETERYGHYSVAGEFVYDHPFQWGSKRTGPDLARVGGRYSDEWHRTHLDNPRDVVPESNMPGYPWLAQNKLVAAEILPKMRAMQRIGVPYSDAEVAAAPAELSGKTEQDALIAYLQGLGTQIKTRN